MTNSFYSLTPDRVIEAVENYGFSVTGHYMVLNSYENRVYDLKLEDNNHIIVKFYRPGRWNTMQIKEEHQFINDLHNDEIPVCSPLTLPDGNSLGEFNGIYFAIWPRTGGRIPEELSDLEMINIGRLIARIHNNGAARKSRYRLSLTGTIYGINSLNFLTENKFIPSNCIKKYSEAVYEIVRVYDSLIAQIPTHRIHGDCHLGNLLKKDDSFFFLDFDDFLEGPAVQDIWMLHSSLDDDYFYQQDLILQGYREFRQFDESWLNLIEPLRGLRYINYAAWIAKRWEDPSFPNIFPDFGSKEYWEKETNELADQVEIIYSTNSLKNLNKTKDELPEQEMTNKDFFWDLE